MDSTVTSAVTYHVKKGRWLTETDRNADKIYAVLSGDMAGRYQVGDHLEVSLDPGGTYEVEVVGILPRNSAVFSTHGVLASQTQESLMQPCENTIFMNHVKVFEDVKSGGFGTPNVHCIVKLNDKADETELSKYGRLVSFAKMEQETKKQIREFIAEDLEECLLWGGDHSFWSCGYGISCCQKKTLCLGNLPDVGRESIQNFEDADFTQWGYLLNGYGDCGDTVSVLCQKECYHEPA